MQVKVIADHTVFEVALQAADQIGKPGTLEGLNSPLQGALVGWVEEAWDAIATALQQAFEFGAERARPLLDQAQQTMEDVLNKAGPQAQEVKTLLLARLREYLHTFIDGMLQHVRAEIQIGNMTLRLHQVQLSQKLIFGGSLKLSLTEAFGLTSEGELQIDASYALV